MTTEPAGQIESELDEESIEQYMARLLERVQGNLASAGASQAASSAQSIKPSKAERGAREDQRGPDDSSESQAASEEPVRERQASDRAPRGRPPESPVSLTAMRELANFNARRAIDVHAFQRLAHRAYGKLMVALMATLTAIVLIELSLAGARTRSDAIAVSMVVAVLWAVQFFVFSGRLLKRPADVPLPHSDAKPLASRQDSSAATLDPMRP